MRGDLSLDAVLKLGDDPIAIVAGNFDGLPGTDLATANRNSRDVTVILNNGSGTFGDPTATSLDFTPTGLAAGCRLLG